MKMGGDVFISCHHVNHCCHEGELFVTADLWLCKINNMSASKKRCVGNEMGELSVILNIHLHYLHQRKTLRGS